MAASPAPSTPGPVLVLGATGTQGGAVARALLAAAVETRALVRDPDAARARTLADAGATLVRGDLNDADALTPAFADAAAVYAVTTPFADGVEGEVRQGGAIVTAAERAGLPWLVLASVAAADRADVPHFRSKAQIEARLRATDVPWTVVAPSYFFENVLGRDGGLPAGELPMAVPADRPLHQVALEDLGALVAAVLARRDEHLGVRVEVAGDAPTPAEMATALGVPLVPVPLEDVRRRSADLGAMYAFLSDEGYGIDVAALRARYPEVARRSFADWVAARR